MKPDWDSLGSTYADSKTVLIADVDCTAAGKPLCDKFGVKGYPTIKYFNPPDEDGEDYKGGRDLPALKKFVETELGPGCSADTKENCSAEQLKELQTYMEMDASERATKVKQSPRQTETAAPPLKRARSILSLPALHSHPARTRARHVCPLLALLPFALLTFALSSSALPSSALSSAARDHEVGHEEGRGRPQRAAQDAAGAVQGVAGRP